MLSNLALLDKSIHSHSHSHSHSHVGGCPCHSNKNSVYYNRGMRQILKQEYLLQQQGKPVHTLLSKHQILRHYTQLDHSHLFDYAFEMATSNIRYGPGVTKEIGEDLAYWKVKKVCVFADPNLSSMDIKNNPVHVALQSIADAGVDYELFTNISVEPTGTSFKEAIAFAQSYEFDAFVAVGGGSTIDTCKAANLYSTYPTEDFLDYVNPPIGKGKIPPGVLKPLIAIPTTAGTGSETTGIAVFDLEEMNCKTGIAHRLLKPTLGIVDPNNTISMPRNVSICSGFDVLCHSLESYTAVPYDQRSPRPTRPIERPAYQGANPISDFWSLKSLEMTGKYISEASNNPENHEARAQMLLASTFAGIGFGNAGVHLCHGMSYPVAGMAHKLDFAPDDYDSKQSIVPHGMSVVVNAPAVFRFTASSNPARHLESAKILGANVENAKDEDAGMILSDKLLEIMSSLDIPNGLSAIGYTEGDIDNMVEGTLPQHRVIKLSPKPVGRNELTQLFKETMSIYD